MITYLCRYFLSKYIICFRPFHRYTYIRRGFMRRSTKDYFSNSWQDDSTHSCIYIYIQALILYRRTYTKQLWKYEKNSQSSFLGDCGNNEQRRNIRARVTCVPRSRKLPRINVYVYLYTFLVRLFAAAVTIIVIIMVIRRSLFCHNQLCSKHSSTQHVSPGLGERETSRVKTIISIGGTDWWYTAVQQ
jgi:hypothetical protein